MSTSTPAPNEGFPQVKPQPVSVHEKLGARELWENMGSPKYVVAPMVDQSELAWRILSRLHGATLCYTPMFHAMLFSDTQNKRYFEQQFDTSPSSLEGVAPYDRPLVAQFCANDKDVWLAAAKKVVDRCDAVDLNLGCPQGIARKGHYGAFLMEEWDLVKGMISHLHENLPTPIIAKIRVFDDIPKTLEYASTVYSAGAQLLTVHGRTRECKGRLAGLADWNKINQVRQLLSHKIPIIANGGLPSSEEIEDCFKETGADGVMSAEGNLYNPMIFSPQNAAGGREYLKCLPKNMQEAIKACDSKLALNEWDRDKAAYAPATWLASQYMAIVMTLPSTETAGSAIKAHMFKLFRPMWAQDKHLDIREKLGRAGGGKSKSLMDRYREYLAVVDLVHERMTSDLKEGLLPADSYRPLTHQEVQERFGGVIPYSHAQPYLRVKTEPEEVQGDTKPIPGEKRPRMDPEENLPTSKKEKTEGQTAPLLEKCVSGSSKEPACTNAPSPKCPRLACMHCCQTSPLNPSKKLAYCDFHQERYDREQERMTFRKENAKARRQKKKQQD